MISSPLTGSPDVTLVEAIPTARLVDDWRNKFRLDVTAEFHGLAEIALYRCNQTGLLFFRPIEVAGSSELYQRLQNAKNYYSGALAWENYAALRDLKRGFTGLEVGCGNGLFVRHARQAGVHMRGIELNPDAVALAQAAGIPVEMRSLSSLADEYSERFDCVCAFQVLEHLAEPGVFLTECLRLLKGGGLLIAAVPNAEGFLRNYYEILDLPPHHMSRWTREVFKALETPFGLRLTKCVPEPLAASHVPLWIDANTRQLVSRWSLGGLLSENTALALCRTLLELGVRRFVCGQSLYARFVKVRSL
jgi:2-polyprenyl-3-methyl-5-hydroxy-6-metoxy-1,4-benzoquinol methylase